MQTELQTILTLVNTSHQNKWETITLVRVRTHEDILAICDQIEDSNQNEIEFKEYTDTFGHIYMQQPIERIAIFTTITHAKTEKEAIHKTFDWFLKHTV